MRRLMSVLINSLSKRLKHRGLVVIGLHLQFTFAKKEIALIVEEGDLRCYVLAQIP